MSDPTQNNTNPPDDEAILRTVEAALAAHRAGTPTPPDLTTPAAFYTALAASAPIAPGHFRRDLRTRLAAAYAAPAPTSSAARANPPADHDERQPPPAAPRRAPVRSTPSRRWWMPGRAVSIAAGLVGLALLAVLLANMAALLERRTAPPTPVPASNPPLSVENLGPAYPVEAAGVLYFEWSPDGQRAATAYGNNVEIWDAATGRLLHRIEVTGTTSLAWSPDGRTIAAGAGHNTVYLLDPSTGRQTASMAGPSQGTVYPDYDPFEVRMLAWSPDSRRLAAIPLENHAVHVWDAASATQVYSITVPGGRYDHNGADIYEVSWSSDGAYITTQAVRQSDNEYEVAFWEAATGRFLFSVPARREGTPTPFADPLPPARAVSWQPGSTRAAVAVGRTTQIWDVRSGTQLLSMPEPSPPPLPIPTAVPTTMPPNFTPYPTPPPPPVPTDALGQPIIPPSPPPYDSPTPSPTYALSAERYDEVTGVAWSPDGGTIASIDGDHVRLWDPATGKQKHRLSFATGVNKVAWLAGGAMLVTLEALPHSEYGYSVFAGPTIETAGTLRLWDANTGKQLRTLLEGQVSDFYPSPTGDAIAIRSGTSVVLWTDTGGAQPTTIPTATLPALPVPGTEVATPAATPEPLCGTWTIVPGPDLGGAEADLRAIAAIPGSPDDVWAVGYVRESGLTRTLVARWDGVQWQRVPSPNLGTGNNFLNDVAAIAPNDVWAVGYYSATMDVQQALALHWDGTTWTEVPLGDAAPEGSSLNAVSGSGPNDVWAVGNVGGKFTLALHWDGTRWTRTSAPSPGIDLNSLLAVLAISPNEAWTVGRYIGRIQQRGGDQGYPIVLRWDGSQWLPMPAPSEASHASALAASGPNDIWAVGSILDIYGGGRTARWDGTRWFQPQLPSPHGPMDEPRSIYLNGVAAVAPNDVWAVGTQAGPEARAPSGTHLEQPLTYHWDGKQWAYAQAPIIAGVSARLQSVAAISAYDVWAVGGFTRIETASDGSTQYSPPSPLIVRYTGPGCGTPAPRTTPRAARPTPPPAPATCDLAWRTVPNMAPGPLHGVVALSANEAWAVGNTSRGEPGSPTRPARTLIERWDGVQWAQVPSPNAGPGENVLYAVDALSSDDIWAVGFYHQFSAAYQGATAAPLLMHWDGVEWAVVPAPPVNDFAILYDVEAIAPDDVWAVGSRAGIGAKATDTLALHWDGTNWSEVPTPDLGERVNNLRAITALSSDDIWAVGTFGGNPNTGLEPDGSYDMEAKTLALHWNGNEWTHVPTPYVEGVRNGLADVAALSPDDIWAVGSWWGGEGGDQITLHWDGKQWTLVPSPQGLAHNGTSLAALAPLSTGDIWGVGNAGLTPYWLHWDGAQWAHVFAPDQAVNSSANSLRSASVSPDGDIWAVGGWDQAGAITLHYSRTGCGTPTPAP